MNAHDEIAELLGAYALDAVEGDEVRALEQHLLECPRCRAELAMHREVAAKLGSTGGDAPEGVWERIAAELAFESGASAASGEPARQAPGAVVPLVQLSRPGAERRPRARRAGATRRRALPLALAGIGALAAALAVVVGILTAKVSNLDNQVAQVQGSLGSRSVLSQALAATLDPKDTQVQLTSAPAPSQPVARLVIDRASGSAWFIGTGLQPLPATRTYQLWSLVRDQPVSISLLGARPTATALHLEPGMTTFMVTAEPEGGTTQPTGHILVQGTLTASS